MTLQNNLRIITTEDGSHTLYIPKIDETYHSIHGAVQESLHVYIDAGLNYWLGKNVKATTVSLLEMGFGTGLNAFLTAIKVDDKIETSYHTLEKHPLQAKIIVSINYGEILHEQTLFNKIHQAKWGTEQQLNTNFKIRKIAQDFKDYATDALYDIIYFDAFAPDKQPELWAKSVFEHCYQLLKKGGVLVTYSAKGQLKRDLREVGFIVESLPGPPGKFEITRALKLEELTE